ncbi:hypothetical protein Dimus_016787, partial [Dionaea muscipula]
ETTTRRCPMLAASKRRDAHHHLHARRPPPESSAVLAGRSPESEITARQLRAHATTARHRTKGRYRQDRAIARTDAAPSVATHGTAHRIGDPCSPVVHSSRTRPVARRPRVPSLDEGSFTERKLVVRCSATRKGTRRFASCSLPGDGDGSRSTVHRPPSSITAAGSRRRHAHTSLTAARTFICTAVPLCGLA